MLGFKERKKKVIDRFNLELKNKDIDSFIVDYVRKINEIMEDIYVEYSCAGHKDVYDIVNLRINSKLSLADIVKNVVEYLEGMELDISINMCPGCTSYKITIRFPYLKREEVLEYIIEMLKFFEWFISDNEGAIKLSKCVRGLNIPDMGVRERYSILREEKILMDDDRPSEEYIDKDYFVVIEDEFERPNRSWLREWRTYVFPEGIDFIRKVIEDRRGNLC